MKTLNLICKSSNVGSRVVMVLIGVLFFGFGESIFSVRSHFASAAVVSSLPSGTQGQDARTTDEHNNLDDTENVRETSVAANVHEDVEDSPESLEQSPPTLFAGVLSDSDSVLLTGERFDTHTFRIASPSKIVVSMRAVFDSFLILAGPDGYSIENDDLPNGVNGESSIVTKVVGPGIYTIYATSSKPDLTGEYAIKLEIQKTDSNEHLANERWQRVDVEEFGVTLEVPKNWNSRYDKDVMVNGGLVAVSPHEGQDGVPDFRENIHIGYELPKSTFSGTITVDKLFEAGRKHLLKAGFRISDVAEVTLGGKSCIRYKTEASLNGLAIVGHQVAFVTSDGRGWTAVLAVPGDAEEAEIHDDVQALVHMVTTLEPIDKAGRTTVRQANLVFDVPEGWVHHTDVAEGQTFMYGPGVTPVVFGASFDPLGRRVSLDDYVDAARQLQRQAGMPKPSSERGLKIADRRALEETIILPGVGTKSQLRNATFMTVMGAGNVCMTTVGEPDESVLIAWREFLDSIVVDD